MLHFNVGRRNSAQPNEIEVPSGEMSVSRRHLELTITDEGRCYVVHLHPHNTTAVYREGAWRPITQEFVSPRERLRLGKYETSVEELLESIGRVSGSSGSSGSGGHGGGGHGSGGGTKETEAPDIENLEWDPDRGTFVRIRRR